MLIYREDDWIAEVEIALDMSDSVWTKYKLKVIRTIQESKIFKPTPDGATFECSVRKDFHPSMGGWSLKEE